MHCERCFLPNGNGPCKHCLDWDARTTDAGYEGLKRRFVRMLETPRRERDGFDCLVMLSGGKDSVYVLSQMVKLHKKRVLAYTFHMAADLEAPVCERNIARTVKALGVDWKPVSCDEAYLKAMRNVFSEQGDPNPGQFWW